MSRSFRIVRDGSRIPQVEALLEAQGFRFEPEPFDARCRRLVSEPFPIGASLASRFGLIYIQDRSSMLPPLALAPSPGQAVLDMCASPGGKTSFLAQLTGREGYVLGNEPGADRLATLRQNLARMNLLQAVTTGMKGQDLPLPEGGFSSILLDPPCSGWGTAEKNPKVMALWREDKVEPLTTLQRELLAKAATLLAPGGRLLYSTCTTNRAENEEQAVWAAEELGLELAPLAPFEGFSFHDPELQGAAGTLRVDGEGSEAQGFYLALLVKPGGRPPDARLEAVSGADGKESCPGKGKKGARGRKPGAPAQCGPSAEVPRESLDDPLLDWSNFPAGTFETFKDELCFIPARGEGLLPPRRKGQRLGSLASGVFRPWGRASFLVPPPGSGPELDADSPDGISALLEGRSISVSARSNRMALYFRGLPLGFLTVKGGRALWSDR